MKFSVYIIPRARADVISLHEYISMNASTARADAVVSGIEGVFDDLAGFPLRGHFPSELEGHQSGGIRELRFKPYRILYRVEALRVDVLAIFDGRRDAQALIEQRALRS